MNKGKVWLVGAGPGDLGLMTIKAMEVLQNAEVVIYDQLVGPAIIKLIPAQALAIDAGKRASHHTLPQEETNKLLLDYALQGKRVVRLKGGDPFLFGRGGEELELLCQNQVPFEIIPGITSALSVPAYNGIPVTHRDFASSLHIVTGHGRGDGKARPINYKALAEVGGTLVFLMGLANTEKICQGLMEAGMDPMTPACILMRGTRANQRRILSNLQNLTRDAEEKKAVTPAIIVVGKVCALADTFHWYEDQPLGGARVVVTRPRESAGSLSGRLRSLGAEVLEVPAIGIRPIEENLKLMFAVSNLDKYQWILFTSPAGVRVFFDQLLASEVDVRALAHVRIAALGQGTAAELKKRGILADLIPPVYDGRALGKTVREKAEPGSRILIPRAKIGNQEILEELKDFPVDDVATYETVYSKDANLGAYDLFREENRDYALFTSSSTVRAFASANPELDLTKVRAICIGRQTEETASSYGMKTWTSEKATIDSLIDRLAELHEIYKKEMRE